MSHNKITSLNVKIAFIGIRGIPVVYSGFESFVEDLTTNMKVFNFFVYCRSRYVNKNKYENVHLVHIPTIYLYKLETFIHSLASTVHAVLFLRPEVVFYLGVGNAPFLFISKLFGIKTIINVDGMDWNREKWGSFGKWYLSLCAFLTIKFADIIITDSLYSRMYYKKKFGKKTIYIPYMVRGYKWKENKEILKKFSLLKEDYFVWAGRLVPDNHLNDLLQAYIPTKLTKKLVIIGGDNYKTEYLKKIKKLIKKDTRITHTGFLPRNEYLTLIKNSYAYIETKQSGGTHPTLLDGLTYAPRTICNDFSANILIARNKANFYKNRSTGSLQKELYKKTKRSINDMEMFDKKVIIGKYKELFCCF